MSALRDAAKPVGAPFPYYGGKSRVAAEVWLRLGPDVRNYVEPFAGSLAVLLARPRPFSGAETVNDADGLIANFWRATKADPAAVADHADWPVNEADLHARRRWLAARKPDVLASLEADPEWFDARAAGWWVWGAAAWIGNGWVDDIAKRSRPFASNQGHGVNALCRRDNLPDVFATLADRLRHVRVFCGDWSRACTKAVGGNISGPRGYLLDPPYGEAAERNNRLYASESPTVANDVRAWCERHDEDPTYRIAFCGHAGEHESLEARGWSVQSWSASSCSARNKGRERIWYSPHCLASDSLQAHGPTEDH